VPSDIELIVKRCGVPDYKKEGAKPGTPCFASRSLVGSLYHEAKEAIHELPADVNYTPDEDLLLDGRKKFISDAGIRMKEYNRRLHSIMESHPEQDGQRYGLLFLIFYWSFYLTNENKKECKSGGVE